MRARILKPDFFRDEELAELPFEARLLFQGIWCIADREGRLEDRPRRIKADVFPYDDISNTMVDQWLTCLSPHWITRYVVDGHGFIQIVAFKKHQRCHPNEAPSSFPPPPENTDVSPRLTNGESPSTIGTPRCSVITSTSMPSVNVNVGTATAVDLSEIAARIFNRHPLGKKITLVSTERAVTQKVGDAVNPLREATLLDARHAGWCASSSWKDQAGRFTPKLDRWIISNESDAEPPPDAQVYSGPHPSMIL